ncbi:hypothetical protein [Anaeromyxobacter paludicola]|uniref:Lipoprotein n=1 Tax=Anaeromyxobacter paludicola TaxID=2918171 RepID=A0ABN6NBL1_9BACT|nr:hypothetical protein [Anaeromyxobacter paludicola]BDG09313.1 hypothetical protein AMPC_24260 [Anaeromyxobacter paludicola]
MSPRLFVAVTAAALGLAGCAHEGASGAAMSEQQRASAGPTTGSPSDPNAREQAASIRPQSSPRTPGPASLGGTAAGARAPALEPVTEVPADEAGPAPAAPAPAESPR